MFFVFSIKIKINNIKTRKKNSLHCFIIIFQQKNNLVRYQKKKKNYLFFKIKYHYIIFFVVKIISVKNQTSKTTITSKKSL